MNDSEKITVSILMLIPLGMLIGFSIALYGHIFANPYHSAFRNLADAGIEIVALSFLGGCWILWVFVLAMIWARDGE